MSRRPKPWTPSLAWIELGNFAAFAQQPGVTPAQVAKARRRTMAVIDAHQGRTIENTDADGHGSDCRGCRPLALVRT